MCYGTNRNLVLSLFAQCHTYGLRCSGPQTSYGKVLAMNLILKKYHLPQLTNFIMTKDKDLLFRKIEKELPDVCFSALCSLSTAPEVNVLGQAVLSGLESEVKPVVAMDLENPCSIDLEFFLNIGLDAFGGCATYPFEINFKDFAGTEKILAEVTRMYVEADDTIIVHTRGYSAELVDNLEALFEGYKIFIHCPDCSLTIDSREDDEDSSEKHLITFRKEDHDETIT